MSRMFASWSAALLAGAAGMLFAVSASAQTSATYGDWRRPSRAREGGESANASPQSFAFELRFGPYRPQVDDAFAGKKPYEQVFGTGQQFYFGLELDWLPVRIPYVGVLGPGFGWGYTRKSAIAKVSGSNPPQDSGTDTALTILPMHLSGVLRVDELMRKTGVPIVPYVKLGLGMATWSASYNGSTSERDGVLGRGITWGIHMAAGGMLCLNWLDPRAASQLDQSVGVNHAYLFGEWMNAHLDGLGSRPQLYVGASTWTVGLAFDM